MKGIGLPDYKKKQRLLYLDKTPEGTLSDFANRYLAEDRLHDAWEFYQRAGNHEAMAKIAAIAEEQGDVMLFQQAGKALEKEISPEDWNRIGEKAFSRGKFVFASYAFEKAGNLQRRADADLQGNATPSEPTSS